MQLKHCSTYSTSLPSKDAEESKKEFKVQIKWFNVAGYIVLHLMAFYGLHVALFQAKWSTLIFTCKLTSTELTKKDLICFFCFKLDFFYIITGFGGTAGAHRLWSHRAYKATWPLRLMLAYFNCTLYIVSKT